MRGLQMATSATWDSAKARIDSEWDALNTAVGNAK